MINLQTEKGKPYPLGASFVKEGIQFAFASDCKEVGLVLKNIKTKEITNIPFKKEFKSGNIYSVIVKYLDAEKYIYRFYEDGIAVVDPYSKTVVGNEKFGIKKDFDMYSAIVKDDSFDWSKDERPLTPFEESIIYLLHVRGFSNHSSSKVKNKGTIQGILQKTDYLKELGITALELMPSYEFFEYEPLTNKKNDVPDLSDISGESKVNYWGFKEGYYFSPKASFCSTKNITTEFKEFVCKLHENRIEVIMQFYFPDSVKENLIYEAIRFWATEYHIDGFHLKGNKIPFTLIANDPLFSDIKLFYDYIPENDIYDASYTPENKNLCVYSDAFMYQMRKVLKGDEDTLKELIYFTRLSYPKSASVNFMTNYYGFTLNDLVSYDRKHNEDNGEKNLDGCDYNFSWNCGIEGKTKKTSIVKLRKRMMKNALFLLFSSKGTPVIFAGDEICNTQLGNNNPYCQDNSVSYINWNLTEDAKEMLEYTKNLIKLRKEEFGKILKREFSMSDRTGTSFPDLSYHSDQAWKADLATYNRHLGMMYSDYSKENESVTLYYLAYNFYWKEITFSLPFIPEESKWEPVFSTGIVKDIRDSKDASKDVSKESRFELESRSCALFKTEFKKSKNGKSLNS